MARPSIAEAMKGGMGAKSDAAPMSLDEATDTSGDPEMDAFDAFMDAMQSRDRSAARDALKTFVGLCGDYDAKDDDA